MSSVMSEYQRKDKQEMGIVCNIKSMKSSIFVNQTT